MRLHATADLGKIRVHQVGHDNSDQIGAVRGKGARKLIWAIVHFLSHREDTGTRFSTNLRMIIDGARNRHLGDV